MKVKPKCNSGLKLVKRDALALHPVRPMSVWNMHLRGEVKHHGHGEFGGNLRTYEINFGEN